MSNDENIYDDWRRRLDSLGTQSTPDAAQKARVVAARAQVDQAISLATIADSLDALVAHITGRSASAPTIELNEPEHEPQGIQSEHEVEVGDMVAAIAGGTPLEVSEVGTDQGQVWLKLADMPAKVWAKQFIVSQRAVDRFVPDVRAPETAATEPSDDLDDDFGDSDFAGKTDADEQQADALAALRARQGKGKKAGQKR